jgi:tRNA (cytosine38-C5)-methyltransferase
LASLEADLWLLSPSCQPYASSLNPLAKDAADPRAKSFLHLIENVLPAMVSAQKNPRYLLVENVSGFEVLEFFSPHNSHMND